MFYSSVVGICVNMINVKCLCSFLFLFSKVFLLMFVKRECLFSELIVCLFVCYVDTWGFPFPIPSFHLTDLFDWKIGRLFK